MFNFGDNVDCDTVDRLERAATCLDSNLTTALYKSFTYLLTYSRQNDDKSATKSKVDNLVDFRLCRLCRLSTKSNVKVKDKVKVELHWLPVPKRIEFKIATLTYLLY